MDMISSVVIQETVGQILSGVVQKYEENEELNANRNLERLEMAHIRLQAALDISDKWQITDASLLRWRRKLKRAAQECDDALKRYKQIILEGEQMEQEVRNWPFPKRIAHATKSFIFSSFSRNNISSSTSVVQRFEWFANSASEFVRFIELGGTPRLLMPFDCLIRHLFEGKKLQQKIFRGNECPLFLLWVPSSSTEYGLEASLSFLQKDNYAPDGNFIFSVLLQVSESTDIIGIIIKCLQFFPPHLKSIVETIRRKVTQLPTLDFSWVPFADSCQREHWGNLHSLTTQWFRPDPFCCKQHGQHMFHRTSNPNMAVSPKVSLEPIIHVHLLCQISCSNYNKKRTLLSEPESSLLDCPHLQAGLIYMPHDSSEDMLDADKSSAVAEIRGNEKHWLHTDITLEELNETMLLKTNDYFRHNIEAEIHEIIWRSRHGTAYLQAKKACIERHGARRTFKRSRKMEVVQLQDQDLSFRVPKIVQFLNSWGAHAPTRLQNLITKVRKQMESQLQLDRCT